jgi:membrane-associated phospholipid phosphatase
MVSDKTIFKKLSIIDFLNLLVLFIIILFYLIGFNKTPYKITIAIWYAILLSFILIISRVRLTKEFSLKKFLLFVYPLIFFFSLFESLFMILPYFNTLRFDDIMISIDYRLLGVNPTVWIERIINPVLTEIMYISYFLYFPMPFILFIWLFYKKKYPAIEESIILLFMCYYGAYITYFILPVEGPRFHLAELQTVKLSGLFLSEPIKNVIDFFEPNKLDCFPSLHAAVLIVTIFLAFKYNKKLFYIYLPICFLIFISLVYCRFHYVIDIFAGSLWAIICITLGRMLYNKFKRKFIFHFHEANV